MNRPLCFSSLGCAEQSIQAICDLAHAFHIPSVEIRSLAGLTDYPAFLADHPEAMAETGRVLEKNHIRLAVLASSFCLTQHSPSDLPGLMEVCRVADALDAPYVRLFGGGERGRLLSASEIRSAGLLYREAFDAHAAGGFRCRLIVETHGSLVNTPSILGLVKEAAREVLLLWDTHHTWKLGGESPSATFAAIGSRVRHMHVKDSVRCEEEAYGYRYMLPGTGEFPMRELLEITRPRKSEITFSLEWERKWHPKLEPLDQALDAFNNVVAEENDQRTGNA